MVSSQASSADLPGQPSRCSSRSSVPESRSIANEIGHSSSGASNGLGEEDEHVASPALSSSHMGGTPKNDNQFQEAEDINSAEPTRSRDGELWWLVCQWIVTTLWCTVTVTYAYLAHREQPLAWALLATNPRWKIAFLAVLSAGGKSLMLQLVWQTIENMRWKLVRRETGLGMLDFIGTNASTTVFQIFGLIYFDQEGKGNWIRRGLRKIGRHAWSLQRYTPRQMKLK
jgi:hypothetical protein